MNEILSQQFSWSWREFLHGLIMAILVPIVPIVQQSISAGTLTFNWTAIGVAAIGGFVGYMIKKFLEPTTVITTQPTDNKIESLKQ